MKAVAILTITVLVLCIVARADTVTLRGSAIPLSGCQIQDMRAGRVYFLDSRGRRQWRELDDIASLGFDGLNELDEAERLVAAGDNDESLGKFLNSLLRADNDLKKLWIRTRLVKLHDLRRDFVQASGHAAAVFVLREDSYWRHLEPVCKPNRPGYPAAKETMDLLTEARQKVTNKDLTAVLDRLLETIAPMYDELAASYTGPAIEKGQTLSGISIAEIREGRLSGAKKARETDGEREGDSRGADRNNGGTKRVQGPPELSERKPTPRERIAGVPAGETAEAIDAMLDAGRSAEALGLCERIAKHPGARSLSRFLHQYGRCLMAEDRPEDAAVMFMRCAVLHESSHWAAASLIETAIIYRDVYDSHDSARRLLERAVRIAREQDRSEIVQRAERIMATLNPQLPGADV